MTELDRDVVGRKLHGIAKNLERLAQIEGLSLAEYRSEWIRLKATERVLQEIVEAAVEVNQHLLLASGAGPAPDYRQSFVELGRHEIIGATLAQDLAPSAGLRNRLVHEYDEIDDGIVLAAVGRARQQFARYVEAVEQYLTR